MDDSNLHDIVAWGEGQADVRAMILTSTRAFSTANLDLFSDFDVILILTDIQPYFTSRDWLHDFGPLLVLYRDPIQLEEGYEQSAYVVQYENGLKIDFTLWPVELMRQVTAAPQLPEEFDAGYRVLLDKDGLTDGLKPPTYKAYIPTPPTEAEFLEKVELCLHEATYVAKYLWRDDVIAAKYVFDNVLKQEDLLPMIEWCSEIEHGWKVKPGPYGRRLKRWIRPELWAALESTYVGAGIEENWQALFKSLALFKKVALEVAAHFGFEYPYEMEQRSMAYLQKVRHLPPDATRFPG